MKSMVCQYGERSEHQDLLAKGLHELQLKLSPVERNAEGAYGQYSDLECVTNAIRAAMPDTGISVVQFPHDTGEGRIVLETTVLHTSGQFRTGYKTIYINNADDAEQGGSVGYWSRICLMKLLGITSKSVGGGHDNESDDGKPGRGKFSYDSLTGKAKSQFDSAITKLSDPETTEDKRAEITGWVTSQVGKGVWTQEMAEVIQTEFSGKEKESSNAD